MEEDRQRQEEEVRLRSAAEALQASEMEKIMRDASNWEQVVEKFSDRVAPSSNPNAGVDSDHLVIVDLVRQLFWNLDEKVIEQVLSNNDWDTRAVIPTLQDMSIKKFKEDMKAKFPTLDPGQVESVVVAHYPDQSSSLSQLASLANHQDQIRLLERALAESTARLQKANEQADQLAANMAAAEERRAQQQRQIANMPPNGRVFMQTTQYPASAFPYTSTTPSYATQQFSSQNK
eukprot:TRINITY_DN689_c0_g2_i3.p1 TRINITY_DN689_c0_g2~~TRINITY_DN689_c0_g2_i3.p1  ORF type:complete len:249 (-),score=68.56 TRINITY_DN689_c0_g2_i3:35-733(-)